MKEIKAILQPFMVQKVVDALHELPSLPGLTISDVRGFGRTGGSTGERTELEVHYVVKSRMEIVLPDEQVEAVVKIILEHGHTGNIGDGKIFISSVEEVVRIRTGERGEIAL